MNTPQNKPVFSTDNFCLAVSLKAKECKLLHISKDSPRHAIFHFEDTPKRERLTRDFWDGKILIEPRLYNATQKELKTFLYDNSYVGKSE